MKVIVFVSIIIHFYFTILYIFLIICLVSDLFRTIIVFISGIHHFVIKELYILIIIIILEVKAFNLYMIILILFIKDAIFVCIFRVGGDF